MRDAQPNPADSVPDKPGPYQAMDLAPGEFREPECQHEWRQATGTSGPGYWFFCIYCLRITSKN